MTDTDKPAPPGGLASQRLDRWLWFTRLVKSRTLAAALVSDGKVRVNRERTDKPSQTVRVGDVVTTAAHREIHVLKVAALGTRRGPPAEARALYEDLSPPPPPPEEKAARGVFIRAPGSGRPTKRDRRQIDRLKDGEA